MTCRPITSFALSVVGLALGITALAVLEPLTLGWFTGIVTLIAGSMGIWNAGLSLREHRETMKTLRDVQKIVNRVGSDDAKEVE